MEIIGKNKILNVFHIFLLIAITYSGNLEIAVIITFLLEWKGNFLQPLNKIFILIRENDSQKIPKVTHNAGFYLVPCKRQ